MAILFSKATLTSGNSSTTFLISGAPSSADAFEGWTACSLQSSSGTGVRKVDISGKRKEPGLLPA